MVTKVKTWLKVGQHLLRAALVATSLPALAAGASSAGPLDLNTADAAALAQALQGVGPAKAQAIVDYRRRHGPFKTVDELALVKGIGARTLERNRGRLIVKTAATRSEPTRANPPRLAPARAESSRSGATRAPRPPAKAPAD
jgi:competence protein ComEA